MKTARASLACLILVLLAQTSPAITLGPKKAEQLTLEDVIFEVGYLKKLLGPQALVTAVAETNRGRKVTRTALTDAIQAIKDAELDAKTQIYSFPDNAIPPALKPSPPHTYPPGIKISYEEKKADFLMLIGADGAVKGLYCYRSNDRLFALAAASAIVKWRYEPAMVDGVAVPVLAGLPMQAQLGGPEGLTFLPPPPRVSGAGLPVPRPTAAPNPPPSSR